MFKASQNNRRDNILLKCLYLLGIRNSEVCSLHIEKIDFENRFVAISSGRKKERYIPIPKGFVDELKNYAEHGSDFLFNISDRHIRRIVKQYAVAAGIRKADEVHPHTLRHSYATHLQNQGVPLNVIQQVLGHERIETTTVYVHLGWERVREHVERAFRDLDREG